MAINFISFDMIVAITDFATFSEHEDYDNARTTDAKSLFSSKSQTSFFFNVLFCFRKKLLLCYNLSYPHLKF